MQDERWGGEGVRSGSKKEGTKTALSQRNRDREMQRAQSDRG